MWENLEKNYGEKGQHTSIVLSPISSNWDSVSCDLVPCDYSPTALLIRNMLFCTRWSWRLLCQGRNGIDRWTILWQFSAGNWVLQILQASVSPRSWSALKTLAWGIQCDPNCVFLIFLDYYFLMYADVCRCIWYSWVILVNVGCSFCQAKVPDLMGCGGAVAKTLLHELTGHSEDCFNRLQVQLTSEKGFVLFGL